MRVDHQVDKALVGTASPLGDPEREEWFPQGVGMRHFSSDKDKHLLYKVEAHFPWSSGTAFDTPLPVVV